MFLWNEIKYGVPTMNRLLGKFYAQTKMAKKVVPKDFVNGIASCVYPATSGQCALAPTLNLGTLVRGGSWMIRINTRVILNIPLFFGHYC